jgi:serine/threonine-protein kinase
MGRYVLYNEIASGGMATVHFGRLVGPVGFSRTVAIKRLHPQFAGDPEFVSMFLDEARLSARIRHPNVVPVIDVVALSGELLIVMEYVQGESLSRLLRALNDRRKRLPVSMALTIVTDVLYGLHAAHEARDERGEPLEIVHRDVSPQNILVSWDGMVKLVDFGIARARHVQEEEGVVKGKFAYMSPEQLTRQPVDRRVDVFVTSIILWEALTGVRLFAGDDHGEIVARVLNDKLVGPSTLVPGLRSELDAVVLKGLERDPSKRYSTAKEMAQAIEALGGLARPAEISAFVEQNATAVLERRAARIAEIESMATIASEGADGGATVASAPPAEAMQLREPETTNNTDLSSSAPLATPRSKKRRTAVWIGAGVAIAAVLGIALVTVNRHDGTQVAITPSASHETPTSSVRETAPMASAAPPPTSSASVAATTPPPRKLVAPHPTKSNCTPPFYFDKDGTKRFKAECL